ncbi:DUF3726 domain-containing protein [Loktanella sp. Alg231-35]|uniref:DUF3726 domain-containing protein n=1 Tax=Loktanella sp. Alg231-35 TaxID=1922220 RepID=UPI000D54CDCF|nr:DUF3726 domain-containing protein [Loktanella sp. Alg231-35]
MSYSLNEIEALAKRAARGGGLSWGISEEAAKAVRWLTSHGLPGGEALAGLLGQNDGVASDQVAPGDLDDVWHASNGALCPLISGAALNDYAERLAAGTDITMRDVSYPLLVVPFAAWAAMHIKAQVGVSWGGMRVVTDGNGLGISDADDALLVTKTPQLSCAQVTTATGAFSQPLSRGEVSPGAWATLNDFAQRTYAPATEASRRLGAGAGVSDND